jgi:hypothetical protein
MEFWNRIRRIGTALAVIAWLLAVGADLSLGNGRNATAVCIVNCGL